MTQRAPNPYDFLPKLPEITVESNDIAHGEMMSNAHVYNGFGLDGQDLSPHLRWSGFPAETRSFAVSCFDPDAPTASGFWHLMLVDVPASVTELPTGAASGDLSGLPAGSFCVRNDFGSKGYGGAAPPAGDPPHRYHFAVHALDVESLGIDSDASPAFAGFNIRFHALARGLIVPVFAH